MGGGGGSGRRSRRRSVLEGVEVVDDVVADQRAAAEGPPVHHGDAERRMEVFVLWQLLSDGKQRISRTRGDDPFTCWRKRPLLLTSSMASTSEVKLGLDLYF